MLFNLLNKSFFVAIKVLHPEKEVVYMKTHFSRHFAFFFQIFETVQEILQKPKQ